MDFKYGTKEQWNAAINGKTWNIIKKYRISRDIWIDSFKNNNSQFKILMEFVSANQYNIKLNN